MYSVNFIFKNCSSALSLCFKAYKNADETRKRGYDVLGDSSILKVEDDYDQHAAIDMSTVACISIGDLEKDLERQGEVSLLQAKAQMRAQNLASSDAGLNILRTGGKPSIIKGN